MMKNKNQLVPMKGIIGNDKGLIPYDSSIELQFGQHWLEDYIPYPGQRYFLFYEKDEDGTMLPKHCRDKAGNVYEVEYAEREGEIILYRMLLADQKPIEKVCCLVPEEYRNKIPRPSQADIERERLSELQKKREAYLEYQNDPSVKLERERARSIIDRIKAASIPEPYRIKVLGEEHRYCFDDVLIELEYADEPDSAEISKTEAVVAYAKEYTRLYMRTICFSKNIRQEVVDEVLPHPFWELPKESDSPFYGRVVSFGGIILTSCNHELNRKLIICLLNAMMDIGIRCDNRDCLKLDEDIDKGRKPEYGKGFYGVPVLVLNNVGAERHYEFTKQLLGYRLDYSLMTIIVTEMPEDKLKEKYTSILWNRVMGTSTMIG